MMGHQLCQRLTGPGSHRGKRLGSNVNMLSSTAQAMATLWGAPEYPIVFTPHPISNLTRAQLRTRAIAMLDEIVSMVTGG
jgi:hypothetical protein